VYQNGQWVVLLSAKNNTEANGSWRVTYATGTTLSSLTRSGVILVNNKQSPAQSVTANITGRTVRVASTTGFVPDGYLEIDQDTTPDNYGQSRIRKIVDGTTLELYHGLDGFTTVTPAKVLQVDGFNRMEVADIAQFNGKWHMYVTPFGAFGGISGYDSFDENSGLLTSDNLTGPYAWNHLATPTIARGSWDNQRSSENFTLVHYPVTTVPDTIPPVVSNVTSSQITDSSALISWATNEAGDSQVAGCMYTNQLWRK
jgi:hypothetical protein